MFTQNTSNLRTDFGFVVVPSVNEIGQILMLIFNICYTNNIHSLIGHWDISYTYMSNTCFSINFYYNHLLKW